MQVTKQMIKIVQSQLNAQIGTNLAADGWSGPLTLAAILRIPTISPNWSDSRKYVGAIQYFATMMGIEAGPIDGYWGPQTANAYEQLTYKLEHGVVDNWRDEEDADVVDNDWPVYSEANMNKFFGPVGTNQSKVTLPYTMKLAWATDKKLNRFTCHTKCVESIQAALEETLDIYTLQGIQDLGLDLFGGCLNVRKMRGGTKWSTHSWGSAIDFDPARNRLRWRANKAELAKPVYNDFWAAWEKQGWVSLGRQKGYDWMHVQAARLR